MDLEYGVSLERLLALKSARLSVPKVQLRNIIVYQGASETLPCATPLTTISMAAPGGVDVVVTREDHHLTQTLTHLPPTKHEPSKNE